MGLMLHPACGMAAPTGHDVMFRPLQGGREKQVSEQQAGIARQRADLDALQQCVVQQYNTVLDAYSELQARCVDEPPLECASRAISLLHDLTVQSYPLLAVVTPHSVPGASPASPM